MILSKEQILEELESGRLLIDPFDPSLVGAASVDLTVSRYFRRLSLHGGPIDVRQEADYRDYSELVEVAEDGCIEVNPRETILGITREQVGLPDNLCGWFEGRSRFARLGLLVHISAGFMQPGTRNNQVLEISNMAPRPLRLFPGTPLCQFIFQRTAGNTRHQGRYTRQTIDDFRGTSAGPAKT
ncbi:MAG: dCTP deaminase [Planctomycetes bacterium]|nr:dCTP deaminase [Planctomycetota bacterium]